MDLAPAGLSREHPGCLHDSPRASHLTVRGRDYEVSRGGVDPHRTLIRPSAELLFHANTHYKMPLMRQGRLGEALGRRRHCLTGQAAFLGLRSVWLRTWEVARSEFRRTKTARSHTPSECRRRVLDFHSRALADVAQLRRIAFTAAGSPKLSELSF